MGVAEINTENIFLPLKKYSTQGFDWALSGKTFFFSFMMETSFHTWMNQCTGGIWLMLAYNWVFANSDSVCEPVCRAYLIIEEKIKWDLM